MKIAIIQNDIHWLAPEDNFRAVRNMINGTEKSDLYVLPEMWSTGFCTDPRVIEAGSARRTLSFMQVMARQTDAAVCGSIAEEGKQDESGNVITHRNRLYFVRPDGSFDFYDKHHLFAHGGENKWFTAGDQRVTVAWRGWRFMLLVCYDLRFPCWARYRNDYDAIIAAANWPDKRIEAWDVLTRARAIENQCYVVACNRTGSDPHNNYNGHSKVVRPDGGVTAEDNDGNQTVITAQLSMEELTRNRQQYRFLDDRDNK